MGWAVSGVPCADEIKNQPREWTQKLRFFLDGVLAHLVRDTASECPEYASYAEYPHSEYYEYLYRLTRCASFGFGFGGIGCSTHTSLRLILLSPLS